MEIRPSLSCGHENCHLNSSLKIQPIIRETSDSHCEYAAFNMKDYLFILYSAVLRRKILIIITYNHNLIGKCASGKKFTRIAHCSGNISRISCWKVTVLSRTVV